MAAFSGFYESHKPPPSGDARGIIPPHRDGRQNGHSMFCLLSPWRPPRRYGASSCSMAASSGFRCSPGHDASGDAACIASTLSHGHQNEQRRRCIRSSPPPFSLGVIIAKDHGMVHLN